MTALPNKYSSEHYKVTEDEGDQNTYDEKDLEI